MINFAYTARDESGNQVSGVMEATNMAEVTQWLRSQNKYPTSVRPVDDPEAKRVSRAARGVRLKRAEVIQLSQQLAIMIDTGVTLSEALECIVIQTENQRMRRLVDDL